MGWEASVVRARAPYALARAVVAAVLVLTAAAAAHTWAGGTLPTGPGLVLIAAVLVAGGWLLFAREAPLWALLPAVSVAQLGLHQTFGLVAEHTHHTTVPDQGWTWQMVLAHACVVAVTALAWWAGARLAATVVSLHAHPARPVVARVLPHRAEVATRRRLVHLLVPPRRGPPQALPAT